MNNIVVFSGSVLALLLAITTHAHAQPAVSRGDIRVQLTPRHHTVLSSELSGRIDMIAVREGESFEQGQPLLEFDCKMHNARLQKAQAQGQEAEKVQAVNAQLDKLGSISTLEVDVAIARLAAAEAETALMQTIVERCVVAAPFTGKVASLMVQPHQYVGEGQELLEILDDRELEVEMVVPSRWLTTLTAEQAFQLRIEETGREYPARIERIGAAIDAVSQSVKVYGRIDGSFAELRAGMSGSALIGNPSAVAP